MVDSICIFGDFPEDITRIVFEQAAGSCLKTALNLVLVSHTTRKW